MPAVVAAAYAVMSLLTFIVYGIDKSAARKGAWRTPEAQLHLLALAGGWPGAFIAQRVFHHKTRKQPFQTIFRGTVLINCAALALLVWLLAR